MHVIATPSLPPHTHTPFQPPLLSSSRGLLPSLQNPSSCIVVSWHCHDCDTPLCVQLSGEDVADRLARLFHARARASPTPQLRRHRHTHTNFQLMTCSCLREERQAGERSNGTGALKSGTDIQEGDGCGARPRVVGVEGADRQFDTAASLCHRSALGH